MPKNITQKYPASLLFDTLSSSYCVGHNAAVIGLPCPTFGAL